MSAFIVSGAHIAAMVDAAIDTDLRTYYHEGQRRVVDYETRNDLCAMLIAENVASVNARYNDKQVGPSFAPQEHFIKRGALVILKAIQCYEYQSCEHDGWETSAAKSFCVRLKDHLIHKLPGYDHADGWCIE